MSPWDGIEEFVMVAHTGSFTMSARRLNVSTSHVSRKIQALEDRLGVKLLRRTTRNVKMTELGSDYLRKVQDLMAGIEEANQSISGAYADLAGVIRVSLAGPFAEKYISPVLLEFARQHPRINLEVDFNNRNVDLVAESYDFAIRYGVLTDSSMIARKLATRKLVCAASPSYLEQYGEPAHPKELRQHSCLSSNSNTWQFQSPDSGRPIAVRVEGRLQTNSIAVMRLAAEQGFGIAYTPIENLQELIEAKQLHRILEGFEDQSRSQWIIYPERRLVPRRVRMAIEFLLDAFASERSE